MNEKYTDSDIRLGGDFYAKLDNFGYHHKWKVIAAAFAVFVLSVCIFQSCTREKYDVQVLYAGPYAYTAQEKANVSDELEKVLTKDFDGNGEKVVGFVAYNVMSKEQIADLKEQLKNDPDKEGLVIDTSYYTSENEQYTASLMTGEYAILLIDESLYQKLASDPGRLRKLSDVFAEVPGSAFDEYGIHFSETALYKSSEQLGKLPDSMVLCLMSPYVIGGTSNKTNYARMTEMFVAMAADER